MTGPTKELCIDERYQGKQMHRLLNTSLTTKRTRL
ncbi:hypothetical protein J2S14_003486 [Lederbergia wuyishanensis]|uniref:Uncharacterized protein n=1 Tax=Lederbergia wuyishanensis TaxID=1347903 RepID=A0ABU0D892_9BACI|nr:hypothetical protein [Lederbergia wuyishanensis]